MPHCAPLLRYGSLLTPRQRGANSKRSLLLWSRRAPKPCRHLRDPGQQGPGNVWLVLRFCMLHHLRCVTLRKHSGLVKRWNVWNHATLWLVCKRQRLRHSDDLFTCITVSQTISHTGFSRIERGSTAPVNQPDSRPVGHPQIFVSLRSCKRTPTHANARRL